MSAGGAAMTTEACEASGKRRKSILMDPFQAERSRRFPRKGAAKALFVVAATTPTWSDAHLRER
jgi:hypothetical protein